MNIFVDSTGTINLEFKDNTGAWVTPSAVELTIYNPAGTLEDTFNISDLTKTDTGRYYYRYDLPEDTAGIWTIKSKASIANPDAPSNPLDEVAVTTWNVLAVTALWVSAGEAKSYALVKYSELNYDLGPPAQPFQNEYEFDTFVERFLIPRAEGHINAFCKRDFDADYPGAIPEAIKDIAARATSNMIQYMVMNKMGPLIRVSDYRISIPTQSVLPPELLALLAPWIKRTIHVTSTQYQTDEIRDTWGE